MKKQEHYPPLDELFVIRTLVTLNDFFKPLNEKEFAFVNTPFSGSCGTISSEVHLAKSEEFVGIITKRCSNRETCFSHWTVSPAGY